ncbi:MAG: type VI secretion system contractile sheath small subunit [Candidatus Riflebacteria bacterium]|nr:type VI secretion system contractile sheath small subunit [Candidatus Riflebacteria bacterium]
MAESGQKFIGKNRTPRVQVEYDVELYGAEKKIELPFVTGVMADLSGNAGDPEVKKQTQKFVDIDVNNFDERMKSMAPHTKFRVPNKMTGEGELSVDLSFESMDDFNPAAVASKVDGLKDLLQARKELSNLLSYMDGKEGAESLINKILNDPALMKALAAKAKEKDAEAAVETKTEA